MKACQECDQVEEHLSSCQTGAEIYEDQMADAGISGYVSSDNSNRIYPQFNDVATLSAVDRAQLKTRMVQLACAVLIGKDTGDGFNAENCALELAELVVLLERD